MNKDNKRLASPRQRDLLMKLARNTGVEILKPIEVLSVEEASDLIDSLKGQGKRKSSTVHPALANSDGMIDKIKLGLATKLVYKKFVHNACALTSDLSYQQEFISEVIDLYKILLRVTKKANELLMKGDLDV